MTAPPSQTPPFPPQTPPPLCGGGSVCEGICPLLTVRHLKSSGLLALQMDTKLIHQRIVFGSIKGLEYVPVQIEMAQFFVENFEMFLPPEIHPKSVRFEGGVSLAVLLLLLCEAPESPDRIPRSPCGKMK